MLTIFSQWIVFILDRNRALDCTTKQSTEIMANGMQTENLEQKTKFDLKEKCKNRHGTAFVIFKYIHRGY